MELADWAQVVSAVATAVAALAALSAVWHAQRQSRTAQDALEAQTQPLLTDVPRRLVREPDSYDSDTGQPAGWRDQAEIEVELWQRADSRDVAVVAVPVRNVGNGTAKVRSVTFLVNGGGETSGEVENSVLPSGERTRAFLAATPHEASYTVAKRIVAPLEHFSVIVEYADVGDRPRGAVRLGVANGEHPSVGGSSVGKHR